MHQPVHRAAVAGGDERHVALRAGFDWFLRTVETRRFMPRHAAVIPRVVFILSALPFIIVYFERDGHLVAGGAEDAGAVKRLEKRPAVRLRFHIDRRRLMNRKNGLSL